ncbi:hypothetical protein D9M69_514270 [compost metagenome]
MHEGAAHHHQRGDRRGKERERQAGERAGFQRGQQEDHGEAVGLALAGGVADGVEDQRQQRQVGQHLHAHAQVEMAAPQRAGKHRQRNAKVRHGDGHGRRVLGAGQPEGQIRQQRRRQWRRRGLAAPHQRVAEQQQAHGHAGPAEIAQQAPVEFGRFSLAPQLRQAAPGVQPLPA